MEIPLAGLGNIFSDTLVLLAFLITAVGVLSLFSGSFAFAAYAAFITFAVLTIQVGSPFLTNLLIVVTVIILFMMSFNIWNMTQSNTSS